MRETRLGSCWKLSNQEDIQHRKGLNTAISKGRINTVLIQCYHQLKLPFAF